VLIRTLAERLDVLGVYDRRLAVAVSGGLDSCALLHALARLAGERRLVLAVCHVNHHLRGEASDADQVFVAALAERLGLPFQVRDVWPERLRATGSSRERPSPEEAARRLRHEALDAMAEAFGADAIVLAHHADDQAETVLLRLLRGTGPGGLAGIRERSRDGRRLRPLLRVARAEVEAWARAEGLAWREDASNDDRRFARNRLRADWLPGLRDAFNPQLLRAIGDLADAQRCESDWIDELVEGEAGDWLENEGEDRIHLRGAGWQTLPEALARRLVLRAWAGLGGSRAVSRVHIERILEFLRNRAPSEHAGATHSEAAGGTDVLELPDGIRLGAGPRGFVMARVTAPDAREDHAGAGCYSPPGRAAGMPDRQGD